MNIKRRAIIMIIVALALCLYVVSYLPFSARGKYKPSFSGKHRYNMGGAPGLAITDISHWVPKGMRFRRWLDVDGNPTSTGNPAGYIYGPLICIDRKYFHKTQHYFESDRTDPEQPDGAITQDSAQSAAP